MKKEEDEVSSQQHQVTLITETNCFRSMKENQLEYQHRAGLLKTMEVTKTGIVKFLGYGLLLEMEVARQPLIAAADNKQTLASPADAQNKQISGVIDWNDPELVRKPYSLFWGTLVIKDRPTTKPEHKRIPTPESGEN